MFGFLKNLFPKHTILGKLMGSTNSSRGVHIGNLFRKGGIKEELSHMGENISGVFGGGGSGGSNPSTSVTPSTVAKGVSHGSATVNKSNVDANHSFIETAKKYWYVSIVVVYFILKKLKILK